MIAPRSQAWLRAIALVWLGLLAGFAAGIEWIRSRPGPPTPSGGIDLVGAGATFPYPLYRRWFADYGRETGVRINYFSLGSGEGIRLLLAGDVDFGATDRPLTLEERSRATCGPFVLPTVLGSVAVVVNVPGTASTLRLDPEVLTGIFRGRIVRWDAPALRGLNAGVALPPEPIRVVRRSPSSGTSVTFATYLRSAAAWRAGESSDSSAWPVGDVVEGNEGVAAQVRAVQGSIGFVEHAYAVQARLRTAALRNAAGAFVEPDSLSLAITATELLADDLPDTLAGLVGARGAGAYPVVGITRIVVDRALADETRGRHFVAFARWSLTDGAAAARALGYAPVPSTVSRNLLRRLSELRPGHCPSGPVS